MLGSRVWHDEVWYNTLGLIVSAQHVQEQDWQVPIFKLGKISEKLPILPIESMTVFDSNVVRRCSDLPRTLSSHTFHPYQYGSITLKPWIDGVSESSRVIVISIIDPVSTLIFLDGPSIVARW